MDTEQSRTPSLEGHITSSSTARRALTRLAIVGILLGLVGVVAPLTAAPAEAVASATVFQPVEPRRVMDRVALGARATHTLAITGVPAGATAVQLNVTSTAATALSYVSICAAGTAVDTCKRTSALNPSPGLDTPASVLVELGGTKGDSVMFYNNAGSVKLVADVQGFYVPAGAADGSEFVPVSPVRVLAGTPIGARRSYVLTIPGVPAGATAVALNLTSTRATTGSFISACPTGQALSLCTTSSALNPTPGLDLPNLAIVKLGGSAGNQVTLYNNAGVVTMIADLQGYYVRASSNPAGGSQLQPVDPLRVLSFQSMGAATTHTLTLPNVPSGATAVALNVTATHSAGSSFVSACPAGTALSACTRSSTLNPRQGADTSNAVLLKLGGPSRNQITLYNNAASASLIADVQGYFVGDGTFAEEPVPVASGSQLSNGCAVSVRGVPACGTLVGAAVGSNSDPASFESAVGGRLGVRRTFFQPTGVDGAVRIAQADAAAGRVSWMSFKVPYSWAEMAAGKGDAWAADLTARLGAVGGTVWVAFHHEPEKDGAIGDWVAMQRRLAPVVHAAAPNVAFSMIVTGWNQFYGPSQYSMANVWPGDGLVDVLGFDIYNEYGWVHNGVASTETVDLGSKYFAQIQAFASAHGVAWGLAETAYTNASSDVDPQWIARSYDQMVAAGGVAYSYFNTSLNNEGGTWPLAYGSKTSVYSSILARSPRLN